VEPSSPVSATLVEGDAWHELGEEEIVAAAAAGEHDAMATEAVAAAAGNESSDDALRERSSTSTSEGSNADSAGSGRRHRSRSDALGFTYFCQVCAAPRRAPCWCVRRRFDRMSLPLLLGTGREWRFNIFASLQRELPTRRVR